MKLIRNYFSLFLHAVITEKSKLKNLKTNKQTKIENYESVETRLFSAINV